MTADEARNLLAWIDGVIASQLNNGYLRHRDARSPIDIDWSGIERAAQLATAIVAKFGGDFSTGDSNPITAIGCVTRLSDLQAYVAPLREPKRRANA